MRVIQIKDVDANLRIDISNLVRVDIDRPEPYSAQQGDVLFLSRGHRLFAVVVPEVGPNTIATGYFLILRPSGDVVLSSYLAWSMNQPEFQERLRPFSRGSHMPMVSKTDVENMLISIPSLDIQRQIVSLNDLLNQERRLSALLEEKRTALIDAVSRQLVLERNMKEETDGD